MARPGSAPIRCWISSSSAAPPPSARPRSSSPARAPSASDVGGGPRARPLRPYPPRARAAQSRGDPPRHAADDAGSLRRVPHRRCAGGRAAQDAAVGRSLGDLGVADRSLIWNTDLVDALELDNMIGQAASSSIPPSTAPKAAAPTPARTIPSATTATGSSHPRLARRRRPGAPRLPPGASPSVVERSPGLPAGRAGILKRLHAIAKSCN